MLIKNIKQLASLHSNISVYYLLLKHVLIIDLSSRK